MRGCDWTAHTVRLSKLFPRIKKSVSLGKFRKIEGFFFLFFFFPFSDLGHDLPMKKMQVTLQVDLPAIANHPY